jgi:hypothetical protein
MSSNKGAMKIMLAWATELIRGGSTPEQVLKRIDEGLYGQPDSSATSVCTCVR